MAQREALRLAPEVSEVARMNAWFDRAVGEAGLAEATAGDLKLCLNEAVANVISYAFPLTEAGWIEVRLQLDENEGRAEVRDNGIPFDPLARPDKAPLTDLATADIGGFGITLIRQTADRCGYERVDGENRFSFACRA